jgi:hypothetical protein
MALRASLYQPRVPPRVMQVDAMPSLDGVLPSEYFQPRRKKAPEQRLMIAVLGDAFDCVRKYRSAATPEGRRLFDEAQRWFLGPERKWPYSFERVCDALDLDPNAVRDRVRMLHDLRADGLARP